MSTAPVKITPTGGGTHHILPFSGFFPELNGLEHVLVSWVAISQSCLKKIQNAILTRGVKWYNFLNPLGYSTVSLLIINSFHMNFHTISLYQIVNRHNIIQSDS